MKSYRAEVTERDLEVLKFILEMKFASKEDVFRKFYRKLNSGLGAKSDAWAKKRLMQLERAGYLKAEYAFQDSQRYFFATKEAHRLVSKLNPEIGLAGVSLGLDSHTFTHDKLLLRTRLNLEENLKVARWTTGAALRSEVGRLLGFEKGFFPDAVYELPRGELIALELETFMKSKTGYKRKIQRYASLIRERKSDRSKIHRVHFLVLTDPIFNFLKRETLVFPRYFQIEKIGSLTAGTEPKSQIETGFSGLGNTP